MRPGKTGWLYLLDRETGEPLYGIDEKPVPQSEEQNTGEDAADPAQRRVHPPHPADRQGHRARQEPDPRRREERSGRRRARRCTRRRARQHILIYRPGPQGGDNWEPSSYSQKTNMFYVCSAVQTVGVQSVKSGSSQGKSFSGIGAHRRHRLQRIVWHADRDRRHRRQRRVAEDLARLLLQRRRLDRRQRRLRRPQLR